MNDTTKLKWRAKCGVCGSAWIAEMKDDADPCAMSFCPDCKSRGLMAPGVLNWKADPIQAGEVEYLSWDRTPSGRLLNV